MRVLFIFDLSEVLIELERDVIQQVLNFDTMMAKGHGVEFLKSIWLVDRLEEMRLVFFHRDRFKTAHPSQVEGIKRLSRHLDQRLYHAVRIPAEIANHRMASLEIRGNDVYIQFA